MTTLFNHDFYGYSGWSDTNPGNTINDSNYWYYGISGGPSGTNWLGLRYPSVATPAIKYRTGAADCTIELKYQAPSSTSQPYDLWVVYRSQYATNFRYLKITYLSSLATVKQYTCIAGTHTDTGLLNATIRHNGGYTEEYQDWMLLRMVIKGTKQVALRIDNLCLPDNPAEFYRTNLQSNDLTLGTTLQSATGVGFHIGGNPSFYEPYPNGSDYIILDYMKVDDTQIIPAVSVGGVKLGGSAGVAQPVNSKGSILIGGSHARRDGYAIRGSLLVGGSYIAQGLTVVCRLAGLLQSTLPAPVSAVC